MAHLAILHPKRSNAVCGKRLPATQRRSICKELINHLLVCGGLIILLYLIYLQVGVRRDYVHIACRMSAVLASETNGNVEKHYGRQIQLYITGMGGYIRLVNAHSSTNHPQSTHAYFINFFDILSVCRGPKGSHQKMFSRRTRKSNYCQRSSAASFLHNYGKLILSIWLFGYSSIE